VPLPEGDRLVHLRVDQAGIGERLDRFLVLRLRDLSRARIQALIDSGCVLLDSRPATPASRLKVGQGIEVRVPAPTPAIPTAEDIPLQVVHEDEWLLVVDKPAGLVVHPGAGVVAGTLVNALLYHAQGLSGVGGVLRPGIVHRLDRGTSGLIVVAKDDLTHRALSSAFASRIVLKEYLALVLGTPKRRQGKVEAPIGRDPVHRKRMSVRAPRGRHALSEYSVEEGFAGAALLRVVLHTGRTHQIRVHLASIGHPVAGDRVYGGERLPGRLNPGSRAALSSLGRPALHAAVLGFPHPKTGAFVSFTSPLPGDLVRVLEQLRGAVAPVS
jgi:23S rRNA pseudouridine1911/1915/1917 synthase